MKKTLISLFVIGIITLFTAGAYAEWKLYDDFENYTDIQDMIDSGKWNISEDDQAIANFTIEDGRLKIVHLAGNPNDSAWAQIIKNPHKWKGIKATIEVESWEGGARARICADIGTLRENLDYLVWYTMRLRNAWSDSLQDYVPNVSGLATVGEISEGWDWQYDIFYTNLGWNKQTIVGVPHKLVAAFNPNSIKFKVKEPDNLGQVKYEFTEKIDELEEPFRGIGTRTNDDAGTCVVYFDDVYVLR
ncbi:MAG: hypothetical protein JRF49_05370 [Deltaproteobacteria bacterium]|nr:hypothetical protein [Deltaproteobacteria bacterium]